MCTAYLSLRGCIQTRQPLFEVEYLQLSVFAVYCYKSSYLTICHQQKVIKVTQAVGIK